MNLKPMFIHKLQCHSLKPQERYNPLIILASKFLNGVWLMLHMIFFISILLLARKEVHKES